MGLGRRTEPQSWCLAVGQRPDPPTTSHRNTARHVSLRCAGTRTESHGDGAGLSLKAPDDSHIDGVLGPFATTPGLAAKPEAGCRKAEVWPTARARREPATAPRTQPQLCFRTELVQ